MVEKHPLVKNLIISVADFKMRRLSEHPAAVLCPMGCPSQHRFQRGWGLAKLSANSLRVAQQGRGAFGPVEHGFAPKEIA
jgi:hypothetical protein